MTVGDKSIRNGILANYLPTDPLELIAFLARNLILFIETIFVIEENLSLANCSKVASPAAQYMTGDLDGDGEVTVNDVTELQRILAEFDDLDLSDPAVFAAADFNKDGKVNIRDVTCGQRYLAGFITEL